MIRNFLRILAFSCAAMASAEEDSSARMIDLGKMDVSCIPGYKSLDLTAVAEEYSPFNGAIELCPFFSYLHNTFHLDTAIETGTGTGETTAFLGFLFDKVHTTDIDIPTFQNALSALQPHSNIVVHYGDSPDILRQLLPQKTNHRILFYLDAHSDSLSKWPLLEELEIISKTHQDHCILVINDIKVPGRTDIPYYTAGGHECSYSYLKPQLEKIFSGYVCYYLIPKSVEARAKLVVIPRKGAFSRGWAQ